MFITAGFIKSQSNRGRNFGNLVRLIFFILCRAWLGDGPLTHHKVNDFVEIVNVADHILSVSQLRKLLIGIGVATYQFPDFFWLSLHLSRATPLSFRAFKDWCYLVNVGQLNHHIMHILLKHCLNTLLWKATVGFLLVGQGLSPVNIIFLIKDQETFQGVWLRFLLRSSLFRDMSCSKISCLDIGCWYLLLVVINWFAGLKIAWTIETNEMIYFGSDAGVGYNLHQ